MIVQVSDDVLIIRHRPGWFLYVLTLGPVAVLLYFFLVGRYFDKATMIAIIAGLWFAFLVWFDRGIAARIDRRHQVVVVRYNGLIWFRWLGWQAQFAFFEIERLEIRRQRWRYGDTYEIRARLADKSVPLTYFRLGFRESHSLARQISEFIGLTTDFEAIE